MKIDPAIYPTRIKQLRDREGIGLNEAKRRVDREYLLNAIDNASSFYELRGVVRTIAERVL
ncbi:MAG: hypothetical protein E5W44_12145 [Mesorhizobium sp.]|nr:MAG: hypothetical protein E5W44_12145 [Mesorhizobium sp.]